MRSRWHFVLVEESSELPVLWEPPRPRRRARPQSFSSAEFLKAARTLMLRGTGPEAWVSSCAGNPVAFLMDAVDAPVRLWSSDGRVLYQNPAAQQPKWSGIADLSVPVESSPVVVGRRTLYRRVLCFQHAGERYVLEIIGMGDDK